jgi:hypothetical protein
MRAWKKIAVMFAFSTSAGILGAACTAEVKGTEPTPDTAEPVAESAVAETAADPQIAPLRGPPSFRDRERRRCENTCREDYARCGRSPFGRGRRDPRERERRCRNALDGCLFSCRR